MQRCQQGYLGTWYIEYLPAERHFEADGTGIWEDEKEEGGLDDEG